MKVRNYNVKWYYTSTKLPHNEQSTETTECSIKINGEEQSIAVGVVSRFSTDKPDKNKARMLSMKKALTNLPKELWKQFWETYRTSTKIPRW